MDDKSLEKHSIIVPELYFLISKFLSNGPLQETAKILRNELEQYKVLPKRIDWRGQEHEQTYRELERKYSHIGPHHLLEICARIGPILDCELTPSVSGITSLLGAGRQSLLRTKESISRPRSIIDYCTRLHGKPLADSITKRKNCNNIAKVLFGRECSGPIVRTLAIPPKFYEKQNLLRRTLGHLSAVYCVLFDRTGKHIITGADDLLVKLWSAIDGRLLATFRGASAEISDIAINLENTLLAAGSLDRIIRVWDLQTTGPVAVLTGHTGMITSVNFCPSPRGDLRYLVSTSTDGSVAFWQYTTQRGGGKTGFASKPIQFHEKIRPGQAQMICASFSPGGIFLAAGSADHYVRVYIMQEDGPKRILETEAHTDTVDSIQWAHHGLRFISGSKDGTAHVWHFESQQWKSFKLNMADRLTSCPPPQDESKKLKVTMVSWDYSDQLVITAVIDFTIKVWNSYTGELVRVLRGHTDELYVLESNPKDANVLLSAGHDGQIFIWDINEGKAMASFANHIEGQGHGGVFDAKWSPDGTMIAATDSHGHILMFGFGVGHERLKILPKELFFHTDYRPLIRDANHYVLDEQTQTIPHLMPPPFLVDVDGNPHPPLLQRMVPGRENCPSDQLIPNIGVGPEGVEVIEEGVRSDLDRLIEALAHRQGGENAPDSNNDRENQMQNNRILNNNSPRGSHRIALRRTGDVEGVRQSSGNWQREGSFKFVRRIYVRPIKSAQLQTIKQTVYAAGVQEMESYRREMRRRPLMINTSANSSAGLTVRRRGRLPKHSVPPVYRTRAVREREPVVEPEEEEHTESESNSSDSSDSTANEQDMLMSGSSSSGTASSDYSDWIADEPGTNLEPPKRSKRKPVQRQIYSPENENQPGPSRRGRKKINVPSNGEIPESYRPPEWLSEVIPRKAPYYPQMGDEVVYLRQGHAQYLDAVRSKNVYKVSNSSEPWNYITLREHETCKVIGIKYEIRPPRLCCLKLGLTNREGYLTGDSFTIKYHDMPDVLDFLVLRQTFDTAVRRAWGPGDWFRCMIDDGWWLGEIESRTALSSHFPNSMFMCFRVRWDNGEYEYMSPWDMEPVDENRLPAETGGAVPVLPEELRETLYQPKTEEWPRGDREASCRRIINGLEQVMGLAIADPFLAPVDLNIYPGYAFVVEYPIDLSTIKARFENHFYRRITSAQFDVRYLATNAEKFNRPHSHIVKHARIITDLCLRIIRDSNDVDVGPVYHQLVATYISSSDSDDDNRPGPSTSTNDRRANGSRRSKRLQSAHNWRDDCRELLETIWLCDDSTPFREPVDIIEHPDYSQVVDTPMDLRTVKEDLLGGNYESPIDFVKDMRLIFQNSKNYNTNKRSRIYSMTLRLSTLFEAYIKPILHNWKSQMRRKSNRSGRPLTRPQTNGGRGVSQSSDDDDDNAGNGGGPSSRRSRRPRRNHQSSAGSNAVSSSVNNEPMAGPSHNRRPGRPGRPSRRTNSQENCDRKNSSDSSTSSSTSSSSDNDSDDSGTIPLAALGEGTRQRSAMTRKTNRGQLYDSEDSYKPNKQTKNGKSRRRGRPRKGFPSMSPMKRKPMGGRRQVVQKRRHQADSDDDDEEEDNVGNSVAGGTRRMAKRLKKEESTHTEHTSSDNDGEEKHTNASSDSGAGGGGRRGRRHRRRKYESDHSYHEEVPTTRKAIVESDTDEQSERPTRGSIRRAKLTWGRDTDSLEDNDDDLTNQNQTAPSRRRGRGNKKGSESQEDGTTRVYPSSRQQQSYRQRKKVIDGDNEEHSDDDDINRPGPSSRVGRTRQNRVQNTRQSEYSRQDPLYQSSLTSTRYPHRVTSSRSQINSIDSSNRIMPHQVDHNYGDPGPSTVRQSRRMLSRHQRNANELDLDLEEDDDDQHHRRINNMPTSSITVRQRLRNNLNRSSNTNGSNSSGGANSSILPRRNVFRGVSNDQSGEDDPIVSRLRKRVILSAEEETNSESSKNVAEDDAEDDVDVNVDEDENDSDPEDNKPLQMMVTTSRQRTLTSGASNGRPLRRRYVSDVEPDVAGPSGLSNYGGRPIRNTKRLQYNEDSDESTNAALSDHFRKRRNVDSRTTTTIIDNSSLITNSQSQSSMSSTSMHALTIVSGTTTVAGSFAGTTRNSNNLGDEEEETSDSSSEQVVSISSRGRVRKITAKARGLFKE